MSYPESLVDAATDAFIEESLGQAFATRKVLGWTSDITFERGIDGEPTEFTVEDCLISFAQREPAASTRGAASYVGADGTLENWAALMVVQKDDRFRLPVTAPRLRGQACRVTIVYPAKGGTVRANFEMLA